MRQYSLDRIEAKMKALVDKKAAIETALNEHETLYVAFANRDHESAMSNASRAERHAAVDALVRQFVIDAKPFTIRARGRRGPRTTDDARPVPPTGTSKKAKK